MPADTLTRLEKLIANVEDQMTKSEFTAAFKELMKFVKGIDERTSLEVMDAVRLLQSFQAELKGSSDMTLKEMKAGMNQLFIGEKLAEMRKMIDDSVVSSMEKMHEKMTEVDAEISEKMRRVKDGKDGNRIRHVSSAKNLPLRGIMGDICITDDTGDIYYYE